MESRFFRQSKGPLYVEGLGAERAAHQSWGAYAGTRAFRAEIRLDGLPSKGAYRRQERVPDLKDVFPVTRSGIPRVTSGLVVVQR